MRTVVLMIFCAYLALPSFGYAESGTGGQLPLLSAHSDRCSIFYAFTGRVLEGCREPHAQGRMTRSLATEGAEGLKGYVIQFGFDSDVLTDAERSHLTRLSRLLNGPLANLCVKLVGHTDARGDASYNETLSQRRAKSVRLFLIGPGAVEANRLRLEGYGERYPLSGLSVWDPKNRRVEILGKHNTQGTCN